MKHLKRFLKGELLLQLASFTAMSLESLQTPVVQTTANMSNIKDGFIDFVAGSLGKKNHYYYFNYFKVLL